MTFSGFSGSLTSGNELWHVEEKPLFPLFLIVLLIKRQRQTSGHDNRLLFRLLYWADGITHYSAVWPHTNLPHSINHRSYLNIMINPLHGRKPSFGLGKQPHRKLKQARQLYVQGEKRNRRFECVSEWCVCVYSICWYVYGISQFPVAFG